MISLKRGNSFILPKLVFWKNKSAVPPEAQDLTGITIQSTIKKGSTLVGELTPTVINAEAGEFSLHYADSTEDWPIGVLSSDIEFTLNTGQIISTATFNIEVIKNIT